MANSTTAIIIQIFRREAAPLSGKLGDCFLGTRLGGLNGE
jgi:hypothetical protein